MEDLFQALRSWIALVPPGMKVLGQRSYAPDEEDSRWRVDLDLKVTDPDALSPEWREWYEGVLCPTEPFTDTGSMDFTSGDMRVRTMVTVQARRTHEGPAWQIDIDGRPSGDVPPGLHRRGYRHRSYWGSGEWFVRSQATLDAVVILLDNQGIDYTITELERS